MKIAKKSAFIIVPVLCALIFALPASAALIGDGDGFYYNIKSDGTAELAEFHGSTLDLVIPESIYTYKVTSIAENAFSSNTDITSVVIPYSVSDIGSYAFYGCTKLTAAEIPSSVTEIKAATFYNCTALENVTIPASVTKIAANAFSGCEHLTICGEEGSSAEKYANEHDIPFKAAAKGIFGDVDGDSTVTSSDALAVLRMSVGLEEYSETTVPLIDIDSDDSVTSADALELLRYSVGLSNDERIGQPIA